MRVSGLQCTFCHLVEDYFLTYVANRNQEKANFIVKSANHFRIHNERDVLLRFQDKTPLLRPLLDEIQDPSSPPAIILKYLEDDILHASNKKRLARAEVKYVARCVLGALSVLHREGFVHTGKFVRILSDVDFYNLSDLLTCRHQAEQCAG